MSKSFILLVVTICVLGLTIGQDDQPFKITSKPFFAPTPAVSPANGQVQFSECNGQGQSSVQGQPDSDRQHSQHEDPRFCTKIQDPVCGSNGRTYSNLCMLTQDQRSDSTITVVKKGEC